MTTPTWDCTYCPAKYIDLEEMYCPECGEADPDREPTEIMLDNTLAEGIFFSAENWENNFEENTVPSVEGTIPEEILIEQISPVKMPAEKSLSEENLELKVCTKKALHILGVIGFVGFVLAILIVGIILSLV